MQIWRERFIPLTDLKTGLGLPDPYKGNGQFKLNQIIFIGIRSSEDYYEQPGGVVGVYGKGHLSVSFLRGLMCVEGIGCERRWVRSVLLGTGPASGHPGVS